MFSARRGATAHVRYYHRRQDWSEAYNAVPHHLRWVAGPRFPRGLDQCRQMSETFLREMSHLERADLAFPPDDEIWVDEAPETALALVDGPLVARMVDGCLLYF